MQTSLPLTRKSPHAPWRRGHTVPPGQIALLLWACLASFACTDDEPAGPKGPSDEELILGVAESESWTIPGLSDEVHVIRTEANVPHIYARNRLDLGRVLGFVMARDRYFVLELQSRLGLGTVSELLGDMTLESDQESRGIGQAYVADRLVEHMSPEMGAYVDAVAEGVNAYVDAVAAGALPPPSELAVAAPLVGASDPVELMGRWDRRKLAATSTVLMYETTFESGDVGRTRKAANLDSLYADEPAAAELRRRGFLEDVAYDTRSFFPDSSSAGLGLEQGDELLSPAPTPTPRQKMQPAASPWTGRKATLPHGLHQRITQRLAQQQKKLQRDKEKGFGSNAWAVAGSASTDGAALVAGDGHLQLSVPALMYQVALNTESLGGGGLHQIGLILSGLPLLTVGTNGQVAWSQVNPVTDTTDWYREELQLGEDGRPSHSRFQGEWKPLIAVDEEYVIADVPALGSVGRTETWTRWTTFDGRWIADIEGRNGSPDQALGDGEALVSMQGDLVVPGDEDGDGVISAVSFDYAAFDTTNYLRTLDSAGHAADVYEFNESLRGVVGSGLFTAAGDSKGNILFSSYQAIPCRGYLERESDGRWAPGADPTMLLDGTVYGGFELPSIDGLVDEGPGAEDPYRCVVPFAETPHAINPSRGFVATANNDPGNLSTDGLLNNDRWYIGGPWSSVRMNSISRDLQAAIEAGEADEEAMARVQATRDSRMGEAFVPALLKALDDAKQLSEQGAELQAHQQRLVALYQPHAQRLDEAGERLGAWAQSGFDTPSGVETFYETPTAAELEDSVATMIFNAWLGPFMRSVWDDEGLGDVWLYSGSRMQAGALKRFLDGRGPENPAQLSSWNTDTEEAIFFDVLGTDAVERSEELMIAELVAALDFLASPSSGPGEGGFGNEDMSTWLWGLRHQAKLESLLADYLADNPAFSFLADSFSITTEKLPLAEGMVPTDPRRDLKWFPRGGDQWAVDAANPGFSGRSFQHSNGPVMRMVIALKDGQVSGRNIVPGGQSGLVDSPHFSDQSRLWLGNQALPLRYDIDDVVAGASGRERYQP